MLGSTYIFGIPHPKCEIPPDEILGKIDILRGCETPPGGINPIGHELLIPVILFIGEPINNFLLVLIFKCVKPLDLQSFRFLLNKFVLLVKFLKPNLELFFFGEIVFF